VQFHKATFTDLDGKVGGIVGVMIDITERKRLEDELRLNATVFDNSSEGMAVLRADGTVLTINQAFTTISGHTRDDVVGHPMPLLDDHDKSGGFFVRMKQQVDRDGSWQGEAPGQRKGGDIYPTWLSVAAVRDARGPPRTTSWPSPIFPRKSRTRNASSSSPSTIRSRACPTGACSTTGWSTRW